MSERTVRVLRKTLRQLLNQYGEVQLLEVLDELLENPSDRYRELWHERVSGLPVAG